MKVLMGSLAFSGHFNPMTGIAKQLQAAGNEVSWYTGSHYAAKLAELGIEHRPFVRAVEHTEANLNDLYPERARLKGPKVVSFDGEKVFAGNVGNFFEDLKEIHATDPFDVLVIDGAIYVQRLVTRLLGIPVVSVIAIQNMQRDRLVPPLFFGFQPAKGVRGRVRDHVMTALSERMVMKPARQRYARILADYGLTMPQGGFFTDEPYLTSAAVLQTGTESFDYPRSQRNPLVHYVGPLVPYRTRSGAYAAPAPSPHRRTVLVTQGTVDNEDATKLIVPTIEALKDTDTQLIVATGGKGTARLREAYPQPNIVIEDYVDFDAVLSRADAFVTNGGFGGVLLSLSHGVPPVCAGVKEGKNDINARVDYHRVGINLKTEKPAADAIADAVERVVTEPSYRQRAAGYAAEMASHHHPAAASGAIIEATCSNRTH